MKTIDLPWDALQVGLRVKMKDGYAWSVTAHSMEEVTIQRDGRPAMTRPLPTGSAEVVLDARSEAILKERVAAAEGVLKAILGAEREALGDPTARLPILETQWYDEADLRMHLRFMHGMYEADVKTVPGLLDMHKSSHEDRDLPYYVPHIHYDLEK